MAISRREVKNRLDDDNIEFLLAQFVDINGSPKVKMVPVASFDDIVDEGAGFAGAALDGMGQGPHSHDMLARPDLDSYTPLPWRDGVARFACDLFVDGEPHMYCPRQNMKRVLSEVRAAGFSFQVGIEPEDANGQYEINFVYDDALVPADRYTFFKMMTSQYAQKYGAIATHMAKPFTDRTGNGGHIHFHLAEADTGTNLFADENDPRGLGSSELAYHFIGGILAHAPALTAVMSPTVNCYKRLQVGEGLTSSASGFNWTPAFISYGDNNRTQMIRTAGPGNLEDRTISAACNPYLAFAAYVAAGMDGIVRKLDPGEPNSGNLYELGLAEIDRRGIRLLPQSLHEALGELREDEVVKGALGVIADEFVELKEKEWAEYHAQVSKWEIDRYLTLF